VAKAVGPAAAFAPQMGGGHTAQLGVNKRDQPVQRGTAAVPPGMSNSVTDKVWSKATSGLSCANFYDAA
jgi:hypothetical protein